MPCQDHEQIDFYTEDNSRSTLRLIDSLKFRNDLISKLLCEVCKFLESNQSYNAMKYLSDDLNTWWENHKKCDEEKNAK